ncbi:MAG: hypothetical protein VB087_12535 [Candidatus Limiplasma sp.]|nr:hypothetical protein [Candidatus Limiplasma sp.]
MDINSAAFAQAALAQMAAPIAIAMAIALVGSIAVAFFFLNGRQRGKHKGLVQTLEAHLNFDRFILAGLLKFLYAFTALFAVVYGVIQLFSGAALTGALWLVLGPLGFRVVFELLLMLLSLREEACETNELLRRMQGLPPKYAPRAAASQPAQPQAAPAQRQGAPGQPDPRYAQRQNGYAAQNAGFNGYIAAQRNPAQQGGAQPMSQRYAPPRGSYNAYGSNGNDGRYAGGYASSAGAGYEGTGRTPAPAMDGASRTPAAPMRPTPADGTGRFTAVPMTESKPGKK